jgi:hypothetical protein
MRMIVQQLAVQRPPVPCDGLPDAVSIRSTAALRDVTALPFVLGTRRQWVHAVNETGSGMSRVSTSC